MGARDRQAVRSRRLPPGRRHRGCRLRPEHVRRRGSEGVQAGVARHLLGRVLRAPRGTGRRTEGELPDARPHALERRAPARAGEGRLVHDDGAGHVPRDRGPGDDLRAPRAACDLATRHRQRVDPRSRARALGRRRGDRRHQRVRTTTRRARPAALTVPGRGVPLGTRSPPRHAALLGRRVSRTGISPRARTRRASG